jgi:hypothetical protein
MYTEVFIILLTTEKSRFVTRKDDICGFVIYIVSGRMNAKQRYVYVFVIYITLCKIYRTFLTSHVFFRVTAEKVNFVTLLCISSHEDMCTVRLLAKQVRL